MIYTFSTGSTIFIYLIISFISSKLISTNFTFFFGKKELKIIKIFLISLLPILLGMYRYNVGSDFQNYLLGYRQLCNVSFVDYFSNFDLINGDPVGLFLIAKVANFFNSSKLYFGILTALTIIPIICFLESDTIHINKGLALFFYLMGDFLTGFNIIKQTISLALLMYSIKFIYKKQIKYFYMFIVIAMLFHFTAIIFIPIYYIYTIENVSKIKKTLFLVIVFFLVIFMDKIILISGGKLDDYLTETGTKNLIFYLNLLWTIIFFFFYRRFLNLDKKNDLLIYIYLVGTIFQAIGFFNIFIKRIAIYFVGVDFLIIPQFENIVKKNKSTKIIKYIIIIYKMIIFYVIYCLLGQSSVLPYKIKF